MIESTFLADEHFGQFAKEWLEVRDEAKSLEGATVRKLSDDARVDVHASCLDAGGEQIADSDGVQHGAEHQCKFNSSQSGAHRFLRLDDIGDDFRQRAIVANRAGEN